MRRGSLVFCISKSSEAERERLEPPERNERVCEGWFDNAEGHTDAIIIKTNIEKGLLNVDERHSLTAKGEQSAISLYREGGFDAVCSDDKRFIKKLRLLGIPYITPSVFVALLLREGQLTISEAERKLDALSPFISSDEYLTVQLSMKDWRVQ